jgi:hypothetical protein
MKLRILLVLTALFPLVFPPPPIKAAPTKEEIKQVVGTHLGSTPR